MTESWNDTTLDCDPEGKMEIDRFSLLPAKDYKFLATKPLARMSSGGNKMIELTMELLDDDLVYHAPLRKFVVLIPAGKPGHGFTVMALKAFGIPVTEGPVRVQLSDFDMKMVIGTVIVKQLNGKDVNNIEDLKPCPEEPAEPAASPDPEPDAGEKKEKEPINYADSF